MSMFGENGFDSKAKENNQASVIAKGDYQAIVSSAERKPNSKGTGDYLRLDIQIVGGEFQNWKITEFLNVWMKQADANSQKTMSIARAKLSELCRVLNIDTLKDPQQLYNKVFTVAVGVKEDAEGMRNVISKFKPRTSAGVPSVPVPPAPAAQPVMAGTSTDASPFG